MSHHRHHSKKHLKSQGNYQVRDNRANITGYVMSVNPVTNRLFNSLYAGGTHYAW